MMPMERLRVNLPDEMKILWVNPNFLHPTNKGGQIRTLEMLRRLHRRHEIHYATFEAAAGDTEGPARAGEYATKLHTFPHRVSSKRSLQFLLELGMGLVSPMPLAISRYHSARMTTGLADLIRHERFDVQICDFLVSAPHFPSLSNAVLFQHNVETMIWRRHRDTAPDGLRRFYFGLQADRMFRYEGEACRQSDKIIAVSDADANTMRSLFGATRIDAIGTGVDLDYFTPGQTPQNATDLVFVGSMDWLPNIDGIKWFVSEVLPLIRRRKPDCSVAIVGRAPHPDIRALVSDDPLIQLTGTVPDIRPYLWGSTVSIVPLRIGGGTRLKIYESMAAGIPVVSTGIGAEGLPVSDGENILLRDSAETFAEGCLQLLSGSSERVRLAGAAGDFVARSFSWDRVALDFERKIVHAS